MKLSDVMPECVSLDGMETTDRRRGGRVRCQLWVKIGGVDDALVSRLGDISATGIYIESDRGVGAAGTVCPLRIASQDRQMAIDLLGRVVRVVSVSDLEHVPAVHGIAFEFLLEGDVAKEEVRLIVREIAFSSVAHSAKGGDSELLEASLFPKAVATPKGAKAQHLSGDLSRVHLKSLLLVLELEQLSGELSISGANQKALLYLRDGQVVDVRVGAGGGVAREILRYLASWSDGRFEFTAKDVAREDRVGIKSSEFFV